MEISLLLTTTQISPFIRPSSPSHEKFIISSPVSQKNEQMFSTPPHPSTSLQQHSQPFSVFSATSPVSSLESNHPFSLRTDQGRVDKKPNKPFKCSIQGCEATFGQKGSLTRHVKSRHEKLRPYSCNLCQKSFSASWTLRVHLRNVHLKSKPHKCHLCDKAFGELFNRSKHIAIVHEGKRPFSCPICSRAFGYKGDMRKHVQELHEQLGRPFQCMVPSCGVKFARKRYLRRHQNLSHKPLCKISESPSSSYFSPNIP